MDALVTIGLPLEKEPVWELEAVGATLPPMVAVVVGTTRSTELAVVIGAGPPVGVASVVVVIVAVEVTAGGSDWRSEADADSAAVVDMILLLSNTVFVGDTGLSMLPIRTQIVIKV